MKRLVKWMCALMAALGLAAPASATSIGYDLTLVAGNTWQYDFTIGNDSLGVPIDEFTLFFDLGSFSNLVVTASPAGWDPLVAQPDPGLPQDGFVDWLALLGGVAPGDTLSGFQLQVDFSGPAQPGAPLFTVVDPNTFDTLDRGVTASNAAPIPEPGTVALVLLAMLALAARALARRPAVGSGLTAA
jgi:hypothetical protein